MTQEMYDRAIKYGGEEQAAFLYQLPELWRQNGFVPIDPDFLAVFTRQLHAAGVPLVVGTGAHSALTVAGKSTVDEMLFLHASGLTPFGVAGPRVDNRSRLRRQSLPPCARALAWRVALRIATMLR